jgi:hypothetical protein
MAIRAWIRLNSWLPAALVIVLASPVGAQPAPPSFAHLTPIALDVATVEFVNAYRGPLKAPNVEHEFPVPPARAAEGWVRDRLKAAGVAGKAIATLREASVVEVPLERTAGLKGLFVTDQAERYDGRLTLEIEILDITGTRRAYVTATATRSQSLEENVSLNEREAMYLKVTSALIKDLDVELERQISRYFGDVRR